MFYLPLEVLVSIKSQNNQISSCFCIPRPRLSGLKGHCCPTLHNPKTSTRGKVQVIPADFATSEGSQAKSWVGLGFRLQSLRVASQGLSTSKTFQVRR